MLYQSEYFVNKPFVFAPKHPSIFYTHLKTLFRIFAFKFQTYDYPQYKYREN